MHVERIVIRNFRGIKHADITLRRGLNLTVGRNGKVRSFRRSGFCWTQLWVANREP